VECLLVDSSEFIKWVGTFGVLVMSPFSKRQLLLAKASDQHFNWLEHLEKTLSWKRAHTNLLLSPPRSNTTVFRYKLHQLLYGFLAVLVYLLLLPQDILKQVQEIISWFPANDIPNLIKAGPLVVAAFVILILPNIRRFHWADLKSQKHAVRPCLDPGATMT